MMTGSPPDAADSFPVIAGDNTYVKCKARCTTNGATCTAWEFNPTLKVCKTFKTGTTEIKGVAAIENGDTYANRKLGFCFVIPTIPEATLGKCIVKATEADIPIA